MGTRLPCDSVQAVGKDHPHACGDKLNLSPSPQLGQGSSPRVWGQADLPSMTAPQLSVDTVNKSASNNNISQIPETVKENSNKGSSHACGDKNFALRLLPLVLGSSPRVWGQVCSPWSVITFRWIIPTRVGTSDTYTVDGDLFRDHPHACGDKRLLRQILCRALGSSPRVWGQGKYLL